VGRSKSRAVAQKTAPNSFIIRAVGYWLNRAALSCDKKERSYGTARFDPDKELTRKLRAVYFFQIFETAKSVVRPRMPENSTFRRTGAAAASAKDEVFLNPE